MQVVRGGPQIHLKLEVLALIADFDDVDFPPSGKRVSNTWVTYL